MAKAMIVLKTLLILLAFREEIWASRQMRDSRSYKIVHLPKVNHDDSSEDYDVEQLLTLLKSPRNNPKLSSVKTLRPQKTVNNYITYRDRDDDRDDDRNENRRKSKPDYRDRGNDCDERYDRNDRYRDRYWDEDIRRNGGGCCGGYCAYSSSYGSSPDPTGSVALLFSFLIPLLVLFYYIFTTNNSSSNLNSGRSSAGLPPNLQLSDYMSNGQ